MKDLILAAKTFFKKGNGNLIKVLSLGIGLAIGIVLIAKVCFEISFDRFYPNGENIYQIRCGVSRNGTDVEFDQVSGAIAPGFKTYVPGVMEGTRTSPIFDSENFVTPDKKRYTGHCVLGDTCFFKVFDRPILAGDPVEVLGKRFSVMVSRTFAEKMGGIAEAMNKTISNEDLLQLPLNIEGVFEDFPENGSFHYDVIISMESYSKESFERWEGNDRYRGYVLLAEGVDVTLMTPHIRRMQEEHQSIKNWGDNFDMWYELHSFEKAHLSYPQVRNMVVMLSLIAFALIFTAVMNYILIVISSLVRRTKEIGVRKCYGAEGRNIRSMMMAETTIHLLVSLLIAVLLIFAARGMVETLLGATLSALFNPAAIAVLVGICLVVFLVSGLIPSYLFTRIPVSTVFRNYKESKRRWKLALLTFQFIATAFLVTLLLIISRQYEKMATDNTGYAYENLLFCSTEGRTAAQRLQVVDRLKALPEVDMVEACTFLPLWGSSGNNIHFPGEEFNELFNVADQYGGTKGYFEMMEIDFLDGRAPETFTEIAVSERFVEKMKNFADWSDGPIGKQICISEHSNNTVNGESWQPFTICGVYKDYRIGSIDNPDTRPSVRFYYEFRDESYVGYLPILLIKLKHFDKSSFPRITEVIQETMPEKEIEVFVYKEMVRRLYADSKKMCDSVLIGGIITLIIALIGLIGYTNDETGRRSSEIAVRKINGAVSREILALFVKDILKIAVPAVILGNIATYFVANAWLAQFSEKISLSLWMFGVCGVALLLIIIAVVVINSLRISNANPVDSLKNE